MLLDEFRYALAALPSYAPVEVGDQWGVRAAIEAVDYDGGVIRVAIDAPLADDEDQDDDEEASFLVSFPSRRLSRLQYLGKVIGLGCWEGYPTCCVLFFACVWHPLQQSQHTIAQRFCGFWVPGPVEHIPCPWHRWRASRRRGLPGAEILGCSIGSDALAEFWDDAAFDVAKNREAAELRTLNRAQA